MSSHAPPNRSFSTTLSISLQSSNTSITRVALGPLVNFNKQSLALDHLHYQCLLLKYRLEAIEGMEPYLSLAFNQAEQCAEQQALTLAQQMQQDNRSNDYRSLMGSAGFSIHLDYSSSTIANANRLLASNHIYTFTLGVLPANISVDPATLIWKLFQQGAPLCLVFNALYKDYQIPVVDSDDLRICKKSVYDFLIAVKTHLKYDDDAMFTISNVFLDSTQDLLKICKVVKRMLDKVVPESLAAEKADRALEITITDNMSKVFKEIVETERKYVQDLELLCAYKTELQNAELILSEQIHILFPNLNEIIDFQRRFLNSLECNIKVPEKYQRIGLIFIHAASGPFKAYEPWTIGQLAAIDLINKELGNLRKLSVLLDPGFELQLYIIKPIQRLCKYPLLLRELLKAADESDANESTVYQEIVLANALMREMANQVNEAQRRAENVEYLKSLRDRVSNWRGFNLKDQGDLLYHGIVGVRDAENEKEYVAYLFERIVFFFVEVDRPDGKKAEKDKKKILLTRKKSSASASTASLLESLNQKLTLTPLELKGRVYILEIYNISLSNSNGYTLVISWLGKKESGLFTLRYRTEEVRNQWEHCLRLLKTNEMNSQIHRKLRDSQSADSTLYDPSANSSVSGVDSLSRLSNGLAYRHNSSLLTFSMMRLGRKLGSAPGSAGAERTSSGFPVPFTPTGVTTAPQLPSPAQADITIRLLCNQANVGTVQVSPQVQFDEVSQKIVETVQAEVPTVSKLKYKDEDGDFVVMDLNDDWVLALDMLEEAGGGDLTIWVS